MAILRYNSQVSHTLLKAEKQETDNRRVKKCEKVLRTDVIC